MLKFHFMFPSVTALGFPSSHELMTVSSAVGVVDTAIRRNFDEEGRPERWWPLSPAYASEKARKFPGRKILERTGRLRQSIDVRFEPGPALSAGTILASSDLPYAAAHQFGVPERALSPRPFLVLTEEDREEIGRAVARDFVEFHR